MGTEEDLRCDIRFYFDGQLRILDNIRATDMVMPWLRSEAMRTGTKGAVMRVTAVPVLA